MLPADLLPTIQRLAQEHTPAIVSIRRHIHQFPELSFHEVQTGQYIATQLAQWGIEHTHGIAQNGVVALIKGQAGAASSSVVALRADIDALPIQEANNVPYKSQHNGIMHACGHDAHTASLLGTAYILHHTRTQWAGTVKLIFQPAEEKLPGGASLMIAEGVLTNPTPTAIIGQHVQPSLQAGTVGFRSGMYMASADELYLTVDGRGGHGAMPDQCIDPVLVAAHLVVALQQIVSRRASPLTPSVLTFGKINSAGGATNVIPNSVMLEGTFRTMDETWRSHALHLMQEMAQTLANSMGAHCTFTILKGYPYLENNPALTNRARMYAQQYVGEHNVVELPMRMTAEDFAWYTHHLPGVFYRLGTGNTHKNIHAPIHTDTFDIDEDALTTGMGLMAWLAVNELANALPA
jgi:amidohydrolase